MSAPRCSLPGCRAKTTDPTGRCHHHRHLAGAKSKSPSVPAPAPSNSGLEPRRERRRIEYGKTAETWRVGDVVHRADGPAEIIYGADGKVESETYFEQGRAHRLDGPARRILAGTGALYREEWLRDGELHREGGPAVVRYYIGSSTKESEEWWSHGKSHRVGGPFQTDYELDGSIDTEFYGVNGIPHRVDGPSIVIHEDGVEHGSEYALDGERYENLGELAAAISTWDDERIAEEYRRTSLAPLLDEGADPRRIVEAVGAGVTVIDGVREVLAGAPPEWVRAYLESHR